MTKVLVLGDELLGSEIVKQTGWDYMSRKTGFDINDLGATYLGYNVIVNCIGYTNTYSHDKEKHWDINYAFVNDLVDYCNKYKRKIIHISSDYIYARSEINANEDTTVPVHDENWYSYTKLLADGLIQLRSSDYLLCRCSFKPNPFPYENAWDDQLTNGDYVDVISGMIIEAINKDLSGVYNIGTEVKTMYELVSKSRDVIRSNSIYGAPKDVSMNIDKFKKDIK